MGLVQTVRYDGRSHIGIFDPAMPMHVQLAAAVATRVPRNHQLRREDLLPELSDLLRRRPELRVIALGDALASAAKWSA